MTELSSPTHLYHLEVGIRMPTNIVVPVLRAMDTNGNPLAINGTSITFAPVDCLPPGGCKPQNAFPAPPGQRWVFYATSQLITPSSGNNTVAFELVFDWTSTMPPADPTATCMALDEQLVATWVSDDRSELHGESVTPFYREDRLTMVTVNPIPTVVLSISSAVNIQWQSQSARTYDLLSSPDLVNYTVMEGSIFGTGGIISFCYPATDSQKFFRLQDTTTNVTGISNRLEFISTAIMSRLTNQIVLANANNPMDYIGIFHNKGMDFLGTNLAAIVVFNSNASPVTLNLTATESNVVLYGSQFIANANPPGPLTFSSPRPLDITLFELVTNNVIALIATARAQTNLTAVQAEIMTSYLRNSQKLFPDLRSVITLTREYENALAGSAELTPTEKQPLFRALAVAKYSAFYTFQIQSDSTSPWRLKSLFPFCHGGTDNPPQAINWWKVLACDCIGGLVGDGPGYLGASACSVIGQL